MRRPGCTSLALLGALAVGVAGGGCTDQRAFPQKGRVEFLDVQLLSPSDTGRPDAPVELREVTFNVIPLDVDGVPVQREVQVDAFISFGGIKTGKSDTCEFSGQAKPLATLTVPLGGLMNQRLALPEAFGPTSVWLETRPGVGETEVGRAVGASPIIYFRNPYISDVQRPPDPMAPNATFCTPFNRKFVIVDKAEKGGKLVVSSVFGNAFVITDTGAAEFNSLYIFSFGRPPSRIVPGRVMKSFSGNITKFVGFTEVSFPLFSSSDEVDPSLIPAPIPVSGNDIATPAKLLAHVSSVVEYTGIVCNPDPPNPNNDPFVQGAIDSWRKFNTLVVDGGASTCQSIDNIGIQLPSKVVGTFNPVDFVGKKVTFRGMLKNSSGQNLIEDDQGKPLQVACGEGLMCPKGNCVEGVCRKNPFNFWTIVVRDSADIVVP